MKHCRPKRLVHVLPCRVDVPFERGVVANVFALLRGTVMPLPDESKLNTDRLPFEEMRAWVLGHINASWHFRPVETLLWEKSAAATVVLESGHGLSRAAPPSFALGLKS